MIFSGLLDVLDENKIDHSTIIMDVQKIIDMSEMTKGGVEREGHSMDWTSYHPLEDMYSYLDYLESIFDFVTTENIGKSYEAREQQCQKYIKINIESGLMGEIKK